MGMRFLLFSHQKGGPAGYQPLSVPGFGTYAPSRAGVGAYDIFKTVDNLPPNAAYYRMSVGFRWYDRKGRVIRQRYATSKSCFQPDFRPDLRVRRFYGTIVSNRPNRNRYTVVIRNAGRTAAGAFTITVTFPGSPARNFQVAGVGAGGTVQRSFTGPLCTATTAPTASLDTQNTVVEKDEGNNAATASCPS
jgi:hypothetical protein